MGPVILFGATGYTGAITLQALKRRQVPCVIAGRDEARLNALKDTHPNVTEVRLANADDAPSLARAFAGAGVVVNTVGPFIKWGLPVVEAAINAGAHYVDSTAEQPFQKNVLDSFHQAATQKNVTVLTGHACDFAFSYAGAALLEERCGPLQECHTYHQLDGFKASRGTARSAVGMLAEKYWVYHQRQWRQQDPQWLPRTLRFPLDPSPSCAVPFPGGDVVLLPKDLPSLHTCTAHLLLPRRDATGFALFTSLRPTLAPLLKGRPAAWMDRLVQSRLQDPHPAERAAVPWRVIVHGKGEGGESCCVIRGNDPYGISGETLSLAAQWLHQGRTQRPGVTTTGCAFSATEFLNTLADMGVTWEVHTGGPTYS
jgi:short subunit dehydrogenase-like uncharacterized protein